MWPCAHCTSCLCTLSTSAFIEPTLHQLDSFRNLLWRLCVLHVFDVSYSCADNTTQLHAQEIMEDPPATCNPISESPTTTNDASLSIETTSQETLEQAQLSNGEVATYSEEDKTKQTEMVSSEGYSQEEDEPQVVDNSSDRECDSNSSSNEHTKVGSGDNGGIPSDSSLHVVSNGSVATATAQSDLNCQPSSVLTPIGEEEQETDESSTLERSGSVTDPSESCSSIGSSPVAAGQKKSPGGKNRRLKARSTAIFESSSVSGFKKSFSLYKGRHKSTKERKLARTGSSFDGDPMVSLVAPELTTTWDPTCLLEELYQDYRPVVTQSSATGENSRYAGYLDKLPVNQRKPTVMKGWKTRFFRLTRGSLFYYDDEVAVKATSFIRLTDSKISMDADSLKIEIGEKGSGNYIVLRADTRDEMVQWHRALQLEAVHPTMTHRMSLSPPNTSPTVIIDLGSCSVRAGIATDNAYPQLFFPTVCAEDNETGEVMSCGLEALLPSMRNRCRLVYPRRQRARLDCVDSVRPHFQAIIDKVVQSLHVEPGNCSVIFAVSSAMPESQKQDLVEICLELFGFRGILIQEQSVLALYSYNCTSGIVINAGDTIDVVPVIDGYKVDSGSSHIPFCGHMVTENLSKLAAQKDIRYFSGIEMFIVRFIKESLCFVSPDFAEDVQRCEENPASYIRAVELDRFNLPDHKKVIHLDSALFKAPEGLFNPGSFGKDVSGIHELVVKAIEHCPIDMRKEMSRRIYLAGGTTLMVGFPERLEVELRQLLMPRSEVQVHGSEHRQHAAYLGASVLASLASFEKSLISLEDWSENGLNALKKSNI